ncbi:hypothetical protein KC19_8G168500 [Ceratodon purpureus]|uniref:Cation efflux protein transmembrane domain-containing protein n=1 Tax=Ceratodon purpureus TaxID=3225 RepID=A0A8T0H499_CERPU|nr:hypothetical protein KC19_8G168500 [Ceratodon purpureus]
MAWKDPGRETMEGRAAESSSSAVTFVSLPLTPPGKQKQPVVDRSQEATSTAAKNLEYSPHPSLLANGFPGGSGNAAPSPGAQFQFVSEKQQSRILSAYPASHLSRTTPSPVIRYSVVRNAVPTSGRSQSEDGKNFRKNSGDGFMPRVLRPGNRFTKRVLVLIVLNLAYSATELIIGLFTRRIGLVSDAFHLSFGCGVLSFSLFAMTWADQPPDKVYTYGHGRLEVLAGFTNALFLLFLSFSLAVEALHAFVQDESEHKHYLIVSAVSNLLVNLLGVWFFRSYARINFAYRKAQDINLHSICLHVLSDSFRSAGVILASWLLSLGVTYAETLCLGLVSITIFYTAMPLFLASGGVLSQMAPSGTTAAALDKCLRQVRMLDDVVQCYNARFWDFVPGSIVGTLLMQVRKGADEQSILQTVHGIYNDIGVKDLTVEIETYE